MVRMYKARRTTWPTECTYTRLPEGVYWRREQSVEKDIWQNFVCSSEQDNDRRLLCAACWHILLSSALAASEIPLSWGVSLFYRGHVILFKCYRFLPSTELLKWHKAPPPQQKKANSVSLISLEARYSSNDQYKSKTPVSVQQGVSALWCLELWHQHSVCSSFSNLYPLRLFSTWIYAVIPCDRVQVEPLTSSI